MTHEELSREWHPLKNDLRTPSDVSSGSNKRVWWQCSEGHEWQAQIFVRTRPNSRCPYCSNRRVLSGYNDLATTHPSVAEQWSPYNTISPTEVTSGSSAKVLWVCGEGHLVKTMVRERVKYSCKYCTGRSILVGYNDLQTTNPELAEEFSPLSDIKPYEVMDFSAKKPLWRCREGHEWRATVANRSNGSGCPRCVTPHTSKTENKLYLAIKKETDAEQSFKAATWENGRPLYVDVYLPLSNTVVEYDGIRWHNTQINTDRDVRKTEILLGLGYNVVRIRENTLSPIPVAHPNLVQINHDWSPKEDFKNLASRIVGIDHYRL